MPKPRVAWSWKIYQQELAKDAHRAGRRAAKEETHKTSQRGLTTADSAGGREGRAPEGTSGSAASGRSARECPPTAQSFSDQPTASLLDADRVENDGEATETPSPPVPAPTPSPEPRTAVELACAPPPDPNPSSAAGRIEIRPHKPIEGTQSAERFSPEGLLSNVRPPTDINRYRAALAEQAAQRARERAAKAVPVKRATSSEECRRCGVPGFRGCEHQLPYVPPGPETEPFDYRDLADRGAYDHGRRLGAQRKFTI